MCLLTNMKKTHGVCVLCTLHVHSIIMFKLCAVWFGNLPQEIGSQVLAARKFGCCRVLFWGCLEQYDRCLLACNLPFLSRQVVGSL